MQHPAPPLPRASPLVGAGRFPRAQGGWCDFHPAFGPATLSGGDPDADTIRAVYPVARSRPPSIESWVPVGSRTGAGAP